MEYPLNTPDPSAHREEPRYKSYILEFIQTLAVCLVIGMIIYWQIAQPHKVSGQSMFPTFEHGDYIITNKVLYKIDAPHRGDVIVLHNPNNNTEDFIKRIVGLPGEKVKVQNGRVYINGQILEEPYLKSSVTTRGGSQMPEGEEKAVPDGEFFVLGDNRENSSDSRIIGFINKDAIAGKVFLRYWPQDAIGINPGQAGYVPK